MDYDEFIITRPDKKLVVMGKLTDLGSNEPNFQKAPVFETMHRLARNAGLGA